MTTPEIPSQQLINGERECADSSEVLRRQVHPGFIDRGSPSSQAFRPTKKDAEQLSTRREAMTAEAAYRAHVAEGLASAGTWGVSVSEIAGVALRAIDDSALPSVPEHHAYIDFRGCSKGHTERAAKALKRAAVERGCLYSSSENS